ncbi:MFS transporter [Paenibacillus sp. TY11]|uniref:MFS transporter n=1 Tax=Paenibacillus sp. TY11 TaxID=3448633 RepID=UPI004039E0A9
MLFYTDYVGISVSVIGTLFGLARIWDALSAPIFGVIIDRANLKGGLFKPWTNLASIILPILTVLIFLVPSDASLTVKVIYIAVTYLAWEMCYTISDAPGFDLATLMPKNTHERDLLMSRGRTMVFLAFMVISSSSVAVANQISWPILALIVAVAGLVLAGYIPNAAQTGQVLTWIFALYAVVPGVGALITAGLFAWLYKIKEKDVEGWLASAKKISNRLILRSRVLPINP